MRDAEPAWDNGHMPRPPREPAALPPTALVLPAATDLGSAAADLGSAAADLGSAATDLATAMGDPATATGDLGSAMGEAMRLFIAIAPPAEVLDELAALIAPLRTARTDLRWTSREAWHVTLAFLGEVHESALPDLLPQLECAARRQHDMRLSVSGAGAFPIEKRANVLWGGLSGDNSALANLAALVASAAGLAGATPPDKGRAFMPHLTLARCRLPADVTEIVAMLAGYQGPVWHAERFHLVTSRLTPGIQPGRGTAGPGATPPRYTSIAWWPLSGPEPPAEASVRRTG
jgi:RNA 2',3'-cyclic 3'-phosphodiesterase